MEKPTEKVVLHAENPEELDVESMRKIFSPEVIERLKRLLHEKIAAKIELSSPPTFLKIIAAASPRHVEIASILVGLFSHVHVSTITAYDKKDKFGLMYHLLLDYKIPCDLEVEIPRTENELKPRVPSMTSILPATNIYEREVHDLMGIEFTGHPRLQRLILPDDWPKDQFPLRKDFEIKSPKGD